MNSVCTLNFDLFMVQLKAQSQLDIFKILATEVGQMTETSPSFLEGAFASRLQERTCGIKDGLAIFDMKSSLINQPIMVIASFSQSIDFDALDGKPVDVMAAVLSPANDSPAHLQRLAGVSRLLRSQKLCDALRDAQDGDAMQALFMADQDWILAA